MSIVYEDRAVLYLDILGFSELVKAGNEARLLGALQHVQGRALEVEARGKMDFTAFSDCIVVSAPLESGLGALRIVRYAKFFALDLLARGLLTRGAVVIGQLYHEGGIVLGPALIDAYLLESKKALYPRILVTSDLRELVDRVGTQYSPPERYFRKDFDGRVHIDVFEDSSDLPETYRNNTERDVYQRDNSFRDAVLTYIERIFLATYPAEAMEKYAWLANYFFGKCVDHHWPVPAVVPIEPDKRVRHDSDLHDQMALDAIE